MNDASSSSTIIGWLLTEEYRIIVISCLLFGWGAGYLVGLRMERSRKKAKIKTESLEWEKYKYHQDRKDRKALRRLEAFKRRKAFEGLEIHQSGTYYFDPLPGRIDAMFCRQCLENRLLRVKMNPLYHDPNRVHCPRCGFVGKRY